LQSFVVEPSKSTLLPSLPLRIFLASIEFHGILDPIVSEQTQDLHYSSPIPIHGLQIQGDQYGA
jgi:hypothetical protein